MVQCRKGVHVVFCNAIENESALINYSNCESSVKSHVKETLLQPEIFNSPLYKALNFLLLYNQKISTSMHSTCDLRKNY